MTTRVHLRSPFGEHLIRGIADGVWVEDVPSPDVVIGQEMWSIPGLIDAHSHLAGDDMPHLAAPTDISSATARAYDALEAGVTLLYDKGWSDETVLDLIDTVEPSSRPHIEAAGRMVADRGGYYDGFATEIDASDIRHAVTEAIGDRAGWVKVIGDWPRPGVGPQTSFSESQLREAVLEAETRGARVAVHTMAREVPAMAVAAGVHSIEHGLFLSEEDIAKLAAREGMWVPTLRQVEATAAMLRDGSSGQVLLLEGVENASRLLPLAVEAGVVVLAGTDLAVSSAAVVEEVLRLAECGIDSAAALGIAAGPGHDAAGRSSVFAVGSPADAVLYAENPVDDLGVLRYPRHVIREGVLVR